MCLQCPPLPATQVQLYCLQHSCLLGLNELKQYICFVFYGTIYTSLTKKHDILPLTTFALTFPMYLSLNILQPNFLCF